MTKDLKSPYDYLQEFSTFNQNYNTYKSIEMKINVIISIFKERDKYKLKFFNKILPEESHMFLNKESIDLYQIKDNFILNNSDDESSNSDDEEILNTEKYTIQNLSNKNKNKIGIDRYNCIYIASTKIHHLNILINKEINEIHDIKSDSIISNTITNLTKDFKNICNYINTIITYYKTLSNEKENLSISNDIDVSIEENSNFDDQNIFMLEQNQITLLEKYLNEEKSKLSDNINNFIKYLNSSSKYSIFTDLSMNNIIYYQKYNNNFSSYYFIINETIYNILFNSYPSKSSQEFISNL